MTATEYIAAKRSIGKIKLTRDTSGNPVCRMDAVSVQVLPKDIITQLVAEKAAAQAEFDKKMADIAEFKADLEAVPTP